MSLIADIRDDIIDKLDGLSAAKIDKLASEEELETAAVAPAVYVAFQGLQARGQRTAPVSSAPSILVFAILLQEKNLQSLGEAEDVLVGLLAEIIVRLLGKQGPQGDTGGVYMLEAVEPVETQPGYGAVCYRAEFSITTTFRQVA